MKIERCPYCNGVPRLATVGDQKEFYAVQCSECYEYLADYDEARLLPSTAIRLWNRRAREMRRRQNDSKQN